MKPFRFSSGIVIGADHVKSKKNCQDAMLVIEKRDLVVAVVGDGCGDPVDSPYSEVGSRMGVTLIANQIAGRLESVARWRWNFLLQGKDFWSGVQKHTINQIEDNGHGMGGSFSQNIIKHFLFTIVGMVITPDITLFFGAGDGYYFLNGRMFPLLTKDADNMPPYLAYNLVETTLKKMSAEDLRLKVFQTVQTRSVTSAMISTDGIEGILQNPSKIVPGTRTPVGDVHQFWTNAEYYENPNSLGWRLNLLASEKRKIDWDAQELEIQPAVVTDDLAMVIASRI